MKEKIQEYWPLLAVMVAVCMMDCVLNISGEGAFVASEKIRLMLLEQFTFPISLFF